MLQAAGRNSEAGEITPIEPKASNRTLRMLYRCYCESIADDPVPLKTFKDDTRNGHIVNFMVDYGDDSCAVGLELMHDFHGPYISILYTYGTIRPKIFEGILTAILLVNTAYMQAEGFEPVMGRLYLRGRKGWRRVLQSYGIRISTAPDDPDGFWVKANQPLFQFVDGTGQKATVH